MNVRRERIGGIAGLAFVALFVSLFVIHPDSGDTNREILAYYEDDTNRTMEYVSSALAAAAALALVVFAGAISARLARAVGEPNLWSNIALAGGVAGAAFLLVGRVLSLAVVSAGEDAEFQLDPDLARVMESGGFFLIVASLTFLSLVALAIGVVARRTQTFPSWLGWASLVTALLALGSVLFIPIFVVLLWVVAVGVALLRARVATR